MRDIRLLSALPVAVHDDENDAIDFVRFYIKGSMVDYVIDTETQQILSGNPAPAKFVEYRKFTAAAATGSSPRYCRKTKRLR